MISGSLDWTIKLWNLRKENCLYTFYHHQNPITCVNWNPIHPVMFASSDSSGKIKILNLLKSFDEPVYEDDKQNTIFNAKWDMTGRNLAVSDENGNVFIKRFKTDFFEYKQQDIKNYEMVINQNK